VIVRVFQGNFNRFQAINIRQYTTKIFRFIDGIFHRHLHYHSVGKKITDEITDGKSPSVNLSSVIFCPSVSPLVIKKYYITDGFTDGKSEQKKFHSIGNFLGNKPYVIPSVII
jgi:hypothetical protein